MNEIPAVKLDVANEVLSEKRTSRGAARPWFVFRVAVNTGLDVLVGNFVSRDFAEAAAKRQEERPMVMGVRIVKINLPSMEY